MDRHTLIEAARQVRAQLTALLGEDAPAMESRLTELLDRPDVDIPVSDVVELLASDGRTRAALRERTHELDVFRSAADSELPGLAHPADLLIYRCPMGDYEYPVFDVGEPVPECPNGHGALSLDA